MNLPHKRHSTLYMLGFTIFQACFLICVKLLILEVHITTILLVRSLFGVIIFAPWMIKQKFIIPKSNLKIHLVRSGAFLIGGVALSISISNLPLTSVVMFTHTSPVLVCVAAVIVFKESIYFHHILALLISIVGVNLLFSGEKLTNITGIIAVVAATISLTVAQISLKWLSNNESMMKIFITQLLFTLPFLIVLTFLFGEFPDIAHLPLLLLMSISYTLGQLFLIKALSHGELNRLMPLDAIRLVLVALAGLIIFDEAIDIQLVIGTILILVATTVTLKPTIRRNSD